MVISTTFVERIPADAQFITDSQDVEPVKARIGASANEFDAFFVVTGDGDYSDVWGIHGVVPWHGRLAFKLI